MNSGGTLQLRNLNHEIFSTHFLTLPGVCGNKKRVEAGTGNMKYTCEGLARMVDTCEKLTRIIGHSLCIRR